MPAKIKSKANEGSTMVIPKFGAARHRQILKSSWASESHDAPAATARQPRAKRKPGSYGAR
jgi:hypothetical protein